MGAAPSSFFELFDDSAQVCGVPVEEMTGEDHPRGPFVAGGSLGDLTDGGPQNDLHPTAGDQDRVEDAWNWRGIPRIRRRVVDRGELALLDQILKDPPGGISLLLERIRLRSDRVFLQTAP